MAAALAPAEAACSAGLSALLEVEALLPAEQTALFSAALRSIEDDASPAAKAAHTLFCRAALADLDAPALEAELRRVGIGQACAACAGQCWANQGEAARHGLLLAATSITRLVDLDWKFGGEASRTPHPGLQYSSPRAW